jgi:hypothetical protein
MVFGVCSPEAAAERLSRRSVVLAGGWVGSTGYRFEKGDNVPEASQSVPYRYVQGSLVDIVSILGMERDTLTTTVTR